MMKANGATMIENCDQSELEELEAVRCVQDALDAIAERDDSPLRREIAAELDLDILVEERERAAGASSSREAWTLARALVDAAIDAATWIAYECHDGALRECARGVVRPQHGETALRDYLDEPGVAGDDHDSLERVVEIGGVVTYTPMGAWSEFFA